MYYNRGDYQGRSKRQVENNYKITFYTLIIGAIVLAGVVLFS